MKKNLSLLLLCAITLASCTTTEPKDVSLDYLLTNPLFAERYADEMVDAMVELTIQNDPAMEDKAFANRVEKARSKWLEVARDATKTQQEGSMGNYISVSAYGLGEFLYLNDVLYVDTVFEVTPGPNIQMYLTTVVDPRDVEFPDETALNLGKLQTPYGAHRYKVPPQEDPLAYRTVVLWEKGLERIWGFAQLSN